MFGAEPIKWAKESLGTCCISVIVDHLAADVLRKLASVGCCFVVSVCNSNGLPSDNFVS